MSLTIETSPFSPSDILTKRSRAYMLEYRTQNRINGRSQGRVRTKAFWFDGKLKDAVTEARRHCEVMGFTFIYCSPFIVDLRAQENLKNKLEGNATTVDEMEDYEIEEVALMKEEAKNG